MFQCVGAGGSGDAAPARCAEVVAEAPAEPLQPEVDLRPRKPPWGGATGAFRYFWAELRETGDYAEHMSGKSALQRYKIAFEQYSALPARRQAEYRTVAQGVVRFAQASGRRSG